MKSFSLYLLAVLWLTGCNRTPSSAPPAETSTAATGAVAVATPPSAPPVTSPEPAIDQALALKAQGSLAEARDVLLPSTTAEGVSDRLLDLLGEINSQIIFTPAAAPEKVDYTIASGDSLGKLAKQFGTTVELIKRANGLTRDMIRAGDRLRIYKGQFAVAVKKAANTLTVTDNGRFFKRYRVGTGQYSKTPVGEFKITNRIENPPWYRPNGEVVAFRDPENILGTHWLGINVPGYGLHGTWETNSIGKQSSAGCVRLLNNDVAELYVLLPVGTPVAIQD